MEPQWSHSLRQSQLQNACLSFAQCLYIATQGPEGAHLSQVQFRGFTEEGVVVYVDLRSRLGRDLSGTSGCEVMWSFPLTNEVYKFTFPQVQIVQEGLIYETAWASLRPREKAGYVSLPPDTYADELPVFSHDLDSFTPQTQTVASPNFALLLVAPVLVDHTRYIDKAAIGNTRKNYESLMQPEIQPQRWEHRLQGEVWVTRRLNAPHPGP